jgi:tRNA-2-methylthio-N6-dimethylallyladenosine synthase
MNIADSDAICRLLSERGFVQVDSHVDGDLIVVNTCSVREAAEKRAKSRIAEFANGKKARPGQKLWVVGCMAERLGDQLKEQIGGVDLVIGAKKMECIDEVIEAQFPRSQSTPAIFKKTTVTDFVSIMRGCDNYCAYCVVPYVRGREQSIPYGDIESTVKEKINSGIKEITFLGQNVNSYNYDGIDFPRLLSRMAGIDGLERIRFTTSHPKDCTDRLIDAMSSSPKIMPHVHLPVQAGSDRVLSLMNRKYTSSHYRNLLDMIRKRIPGVDITTDILVGFPSETDAEFRETLSLVREARFTTAFMFAYSSREGTAAASMAGEVAKPEKLARLSELIALQTEITREIYEKTVGKELKVLITDRQEKRDLAWMGQDEGCKRVLISCETAAPGMIFNVKAIRSSGMTLIAEVV